MPKTVISLGDKMIKLREERELLGRCLIIQSSRPELVSKLEDTIGQFEMSVVPRSICSSDGSLFIPSDKSSLMKTIQNMAGPINQTELPTIHPCSRVDKVKVFDAMAVLRASYEKICEDQNTVRSNQRLL